MDIYTVLGIFGSAVILVVFVLNQMHKLSRDSVVYDIANAFGSFLLVVYAVAIHSYPFVLLNAVWLGMSLYDCYSDYRALNR